MLTLVGGIMVISIVMVLSTKEAGLLALILFVCYCFPILALIVFALAFLLYHSH